MLAKILSYMPVWLFDRLPYRVKREIMLIWLTDENLEVGVEEHRADGTKRVIRRR